MPIQVVVNGETHTVSASDISGSEDGFYVGKQSDLDQMISARLSKKESQLKDAHGTELTEQRSKLLADDSFLQEIADKRGFKIENGKVITEIPESRIKEMEAAWKDEHLTPMEQKLKSTRQRTLMRDIQETARIAGVKESSLENIFDPNEPSSFVKEAASRAELNEETGQYEYTLGDDKVGVKEYLDHLRKQDTRNIHFERSVPNKTGIGGNKPARSQVQQSYSLDEWNELGPAEQNRLKESKDWKEGKIELETPEGLQGLFE